jgi:hypothetical protein
MLEISVKKSKDMSFLTCYMGSPMSSVSSCNVVMASSSILMCSSFLLSPISFRLRTSFVWFSMVDQELIPTRFMSQIQVDSTSSACVEHFGLNGFSERGMGAVTDMLDAMDYSPLFRPFGNIILLCYECFSRFPSSKILCYCASAHCDSGVPIQRFLCLN